jgi:thymidylate synthase (FAD)
MKRNVLDRGSVELIESWGSDERIVEAARMSTGGGFRGWGPNGCPRCSYAAPELGVQNADCTCGGTGEVPGDEKLLAYLWRNAHATPFEMAGATFEVKAPIFVFREWHRHRTQSYNEMSARYAPLPDEDYFPTVERLLADGGKNRQARGADGAAALDAAHAELFLEKLWAFRRTGQRLYEEAIANGVPKELARLAVTVGRYSRMRASANLRNWLAFLALRNAPAAQAEIREYAVVVESELGAVFPRTLALFREGQMTSRT